MAASSVAGVAMQKQAQTQQGRAQRDQERAAKQQEQDAQRAFRKQNQKAPDLASLLAGNLSNAQGGIGSTMLTGPSGVDAGALSLGKSSLLGA